MSLAAAASRFSPTMQAGSVTWTGTGGGRTNPTQTMMNQPVYLDHNATTPVGAEVLEAMLPFFRQHFGNPSSATPLGRCARDAIENARGQVAALIGADAREIIFTGGGTEASNHRCRPGRATARAGSPR